MVLSPCSKNGLRIGFWLELTVNFMTLDEPCEELVTMNVRTSLGWIRSALAVSAEAVTASLACVCSTAGVIFDAAMNWLMVKLAGANAEVAESAFPGCVPATCGVGVWLMMLDA